MTLEEAFPPINTGITPLGGRVLLQLKRVPSQTSSGIILPEDAQLSEKVQTMAAKVIAVGPLAFKNRETATDWPEGTWCNVGDYVRAPRWSGDRFEMPVNDNEKDMVAFIIMNDYELWAKVDPSQVLTMKAYIG